MSTAAGIVIGDEILSGKVADTNSGVLIQVLHEVGCRLTRLSTIGDDPRQIADEVNLCRSRCDVVITSGGVGPTHDDRTMEGLALALGRTVIRDPELERLVRGHWGARINDAALKLAQVPQGARLIGSADGLLPLVAVENIYILPGIPQLFSAKMQLLRHEIVGEPVELHSIYLRADESNIAAHLAHVEAEFTGVTVGSYPRLHDPDHRVRVTVESRVDAGATPAVQRLLTLLPADMIVRVTRDQ